MKSNRKSFKKLSSEIVSEFVGLFLGNVYNKVGLSVLLFVIGLILFFSPIQEVEKRPIGFYIIGGILFVTSVLLIFKRYNEIKDENE